MNNIKHEVANAVADAVDQCLLSGTIDEFVNSRAVNSLMSSYDEETVELIETTVPMITRFVLSALTNSTNEEAEYGIEVTKLEHNGGTLLEEYFFMIENKELTTD